MPPPPSEEYALRIGRRNCSSVSLFCSHGVAGSPLIEPVTIEGVQLDLLSELVKLVTVKGALFCNAEFTAPWAVRSPSAHLLARHLVADAAHLIIYHFVIEGSAWAQLEGCPKVELQPGDVVIFPHGDAHLIGNGPPTSPMDGSKEIERILAQGVEVARTGGGGEVTRLVCGFMACDPHMTPVALAGLPPLFKVNIRSDLSGAWMEDSIRFSVQHALAGFTGAGAVLAKLSEALFAETLRRYLALLPAGETGWLAGARDPAVGKALGLLHHEPARVWTIADLAAGVGVSRAVLAERFRQLLGEAPIAYLTRWRLQLGARLLAKSNQGVAEIGAQVGYDSEAAFNRAFKREFGLPPARFRRQSKAAAQA